MITDIKQRPNQLPKTDSYQQRMAQLPVPIQRQIEAVAKGQEEIFARYLLEQMKPESSEEGDQETSSSMSYYKSMLNDEHAKILAEREVLGIGPLVKQQLVQAIGNRFPANNTMTKPATTNHTGNAHD